MRSLSLAVAVVAGIAAGCATTARDHTGGAPDAVSGLAGLDKLPPPDTGGEAQAYLSGSLAAMRAGKPADAAVFLDAILRSDHLSERGRANVYWLAAEAHGMAGDDDGH